MKAHVILVIEDNPSTRKIVRLTLGNEGFTVIEASDGAQGLELASTALPDLILQDLLLPDMDGFTLIGRLRARPELEGVPIIAFSGFLSRLEHGRAAAAGFSDFMPKPVEPSRLVQVVRTHLPPDLVTPENIGRGQHVLVVDDDPVQLKLTRIRLAGLGLTVATATNGVEALELLHREGADAVVSDVLMPRLDGFGLCVEMRKVSRFSQLPIILVSSNYVDDADRDLALKMGATAFVVRTPNLREVIRALGAALYAPSDLPLPSVHVATTEHHERVLRQLERQVVMNAAFAHRSSMHASMLSVVAGMSESLTRRQSPEDAAPDILASLLEASGVSMGALFETNAGASEPGSTALDNVTLRARMGFSSAVGEELGAFLGHREIFERAVASKSPVVVGSPDECPGGRDLLARAGLKSALLVPFLSQEECLGILLLASKGRDLTESDWIPFARTIAVQIGQALSLGRAFARLEHEVGERKQAESDARQERDRAQGYLDTADVVLLVLDMKGRVTLINRKGCDLLGWAADELLGRDFIETCVPARIRDETKRRLSDVHGGDDSVIETPIVSRSGDERLIEWRTTLLRDNEGQIVSTLSSGTDITERKRAEQEIRDRASLSALGAAVGLALIEADSLPHALQRCAEALVTHLGATFARIWTLDEGEGMLELQASAGLYTHLNGPHGRVPVGQFKIGRIARDRKPHLTNTVIGDPEVSDQEWARREGMVAFAGHPLIANDRVIGVMALFARHPFSDSVIAALASVADHLALGIERHRSAEALRTTEERMRFALTNADVGIWDMDYATGVLRWSEVAEAHYGLQPGTFTGTFDAFLERVHPDDRKSLLETMGNAMKTGADFSTLNRSLWPDGTVRWVSGAGRILLGEHGEPVRGVGISMDITERRTLEQQFQQAQKMEAVGRLAGGVAHDFNNLLTVILGFCELLQADRDPSDPHQADISEIQKAGTRAAALTQQLLGFSRKQIIEPTLLDLNVVVADLGAMLGRLIREDVKIVFALRPELALVLVDRGQIEQIVMNLAVNARDVMPDGGTLTIETANVELDDDDAKSHRYVKPGLYVALTVTDTGTGMTPEVQARLFEPFFTTKELGKGTGLGLATVYGIVKRNGGSILVDSEVGRGTAFKVYFPRADAAAIAVEMPAPVVRPTAVSQTVLLVEDEEGLRNLARRLLQQLGFTVLVAADATEAHRLFDEHPAIDLFLTDVVMPGTSGPELTSQLIEQRPSLKVLYMSGYPEDAIARHGVLKPGIAFLNKPFTSQTLGEKIREVLER